MRGLVLGAIVGDSLVVLRRARFMDNDAVEWSASIREHGVVITAFPDALEVPIAGLQRRAGLGSVFGTRDTGWHGDFEQPIDRHRSEIAAK